MSEEGIKHKLAAILSADAVGYSRLMAEDEIATIRTLSAYRNNISNHVQENSGRIVDFVGDNMLAEFSSALAAVDCALKIQEKLEQLNAKLDEHRRMHFRIGIDLGEVFVSKDVIYGDGINIASRLESLAEPGGICISEFVYSQVHNKLDVGFVDVGTKTLKNISTPVRVYKVGEQKTVASTLETGETMDQALSLPLPNKPSPAVLPFVNLSADSQQDYFSGQYEEAIESVKEVLKSDEGNLDALLILASAFAALGQQEEASKAAKKIKRIKPDFSLKEYAKTQPYSDPKILEQVTCMLQRAGVQLRNCLKAWGRTGNKTRLGDSQP